MTRICRFGNNRLGVIEGDSIYDVTFALNVLPQARWPLPVGDPLVTHLDAVLDAALARLDRAERLSLGGVRFLSPVANPSKIIAAPVNYLKHQAEADADGGKNFDKDVKTIDHYGLFLKASSSLIGFGETIAIDFPERRTDHEIELVVVIGKGGRNIPREHALDHVAGYCMGLDMTLRGPEDRSLRKSVDGFSVAGPWLVTPDEIADPNDLMMTLEVNGEPRQRASTRDLIFDVHKLIEYASGFYTLHPGDLLYTGTPEGVGPVVAGDRIFCAIEGIASAGIDVIAP